MAQGMLQVLLSAQGTLLAHAHRREALLHELVVVMLVEPDLHLVLDGPIRPRAATAIECEQGHDRVDHHEGEKDDRDRRTPT